MKITELAFTGYPVTDMARARRFYEGVLGLTVSRTWGDKENPNWVEYDLGANCLALATGAGDQWPPANAGPAVAFEVEDFDAAIAELKAAGVKFFWDVQESPVCFMAGILDPDENRVVIHRRKAGAGS
jgi:predicted enzyme related to lactoylglutathione lyase